MQYAYPAFSNSMLMSVWLLLHKPSSYGSGRGTGMQLCKQKNPYPAYPGHWVITKCLCSWPIDYIGGLPWTKTLHCPHTKSIRFDSNPLFVKVFGICTCRASYTNALHDRDGKMIGDGTDFCDCLELNCPGCHFPCVKCGSQKCSVDCRKNRKWTPDHIELEGTERVVTLDKTLRDYHQKIAAQLAARAQQNNKT